MAPHSNSTVHLPPVLSQHSTCSEISPDAFGSLPFEVQIPRWFFWIQNKWNFFCFVCFDFGFLFCIIIFFFFKETYLCVREWMLTAKPRVLG